MSKIYTIEIAKHTLCLNFNQNPPENFLEEFFKKYSLFFSPGHPQIHIDVQLTDNTPEEFYPWSKVTFKDNLITIKDDCLCGSLDWLKKRGRLNLNPRNPLSPLGTFLRIICTYLVVLEDKGVALHAVGVLKDEGAYVFIGPSGAGKSTVARLSGEKTVLSDDLLLIKKVEGKFKVFPAPDWGDQQRGPRQNKPYSLNSIYKLIKDNQVYLEKISRSHALADIFTTPHASIGRIPQDALLATFAELINSIPYYGLHFLPEPSFWNCIAESRYLAKGVLSCR